MFNPIDTVLNTISSLFYRYKNYILYSFTTKKHRQNVRENHCLGFCLRHSDRKKNIPRLGCSGRRVYNHHAGLYESSIFYFCVDCPYREREDNW